MKSIYGRSSLVIPLSRSLWMAIGATICWAIVFSTSAASIPQLFNTGVDDSGTPLTANKVDPHYKIIEIPDAVTVDTNAFTLTPGFPVPPWIAEGPTSRWIAPMANQSTGSPAGNYTYRITFDLTGFDPAKAAITGRWVTDNGGVDIVLNGTALGIVNPGNFGGWTDANNFTIDSGFVAGKNTLDFILNNAEPGINPTGLRVEMRGTVELPAEAPSIVDQPQTKTAIVGEEIVFNVTGQGTPPLTYQWQLNGQDIAGATEPAYTIAAVGLAQAGDYTVVVKNAFGSKPSAAATLTVLEPIPGLFSTGVNDAHAVLDDGAEDPHYALVTNADGAATDPIVHDSTVFPIVTGPWVANSEVSKWIAPRFDTTEAAGGEYAYRTTFKLGDFDAATVVLFGQWATDNPGLDILVNGASTGLQNNAQFGGFTPFTLNTGFVSGENTIDFKLRNEGTGYTGLRVDALRGGARKKSGPAVEPPRIVAQPVGKTAFAGESVTLSVLADGAKPLTYQWRRSGQILTGKAEAALTLGNVALNDAGDYVVTVSNVAGTKDSAAATLVVVQSVPILFNTGVGTDGKILTDGTVDPHYQFVANAQDAQGKDALVEDSTVFPIVDGPWVANTDTSKWIGPVFDSNGAAGDYLYRTTFDLTGFDPATAYLEGSWATDNIGPDMLLNGASAGLQNNAQFVSLTKFTIVAGFKAGENTLEFAVNNAGTDANPTGLRIEGLRLGARPAIAAGPRLTVTRTGSELTLSWLKGAEGYNLFSSPSLAPLIWTAVTETVTGTVDQNTVKIQTTDAAHFFRLQR